MYNVWPSAPQLFDDRYRLERTLGQGNFGVVYRAWDSKFECYVALKQLHPYLLYDAEALNKVRHEAKILRSLHHPNILRVNDFEVGPNLAYLTTDLAEGGSLAQRLNTNANTPPMHMPLSEVAGLLHKIAGALDAAHAAGLVHADIKPENILLDRAGEPLLADFGTSVVVGTKATTRLVSPTELWATLEYAAPELWQGQVTQASDIYALGVLVFLLVSSQLPFVEDKYTLKWQHQNAPVPTLAERAPWLRYPPELDEVIARAMAKDRHQRTRTARELAQQFQAALDGPPAPQTSSPAIVQISERSTQPQPLSLDDEFSAKSLAVLHGSGLGSVRGLAWSPTGKLLASTTAFGAIQLWSENGRGVGVFTGHSNVVSGVAWSPDGEILASASWDKTLILWRADDKNYLMLEGHTDQVRCTGWSPNGQTLASGGADRTLRLWNRKGKLEQTFSGYSDILMGLAWSKDNKTVAALTWDGRVWLRNTYNRVAWSFGAHAAMSYDLAMSPNGQTLATASADKTVRLWNNDGTQQAVFNGHTDTVFSVTWSPDGQRLASGSADGSVRIWTVEGESLATLHGHSGAVYKVAWSPDSTILASSAADSTVRLWQTI